MSWDDSTAPADAWGAPSAPEDSFSAVRAPESSFSACAAPGAARGYGGSDAGNAGETDGDGDGDAPRDNTCRYCKEEGHMARDCPTKPANDGACFNCGEQGHNKSDCPNPRKFTGICRVCSQEGHSARECPERPPSLCRNCQEEGHMASECTNSRKMDLSHVADRDMESAWADMKKANDEDEFDEFKIHMLEYIKANPGMGLDELENAFRSQGFRYYLYALTIEVTYDKVLVGPHGEKDVKYIWTLNKAARPRRSKSIQHRMAPTPEENLVRLKSAGTLEDEITPFCHNCKEKGHLRANCEIEQPEDDMKDRVVLKCNNCQALDHRMRDCDQPRKDFNACRNCGEVGHRSTECENPRVASADTECRRCNGKGHFAKECPEFANRVDECFNCGEEGHRKEDCTNERVMKCRNCDERGHMSKECPKPRDITRVKCNNCGEMGHFSRGCTKEKPAEEEPEEEIVYGAGTQDTTEEPAPSGKMGVWGGNSEAVLDPVGTWASGVAEDTMGGW